MQGTLSNDALLHRPTSTKSMPGLPREGIEAVRQPAPRTPPRSYDSLRGIKQEAEESSEFLDDLFGPDKRHL